MKPFDYEIATQKIHTALKHLPPESQREVLLELLRKEKGLSGIAEQQRESIADEVLRGSSVMFLSGDQVDVDAVNAKAAAGRIKLTDNDGKTVPRASANELKGFVTMVQRNDDPKLEVNTLQGITTFGRSSSLSPESAAMMVHQHLDVNKPNSTKAFAARELASNLNNTATSAESERAKALELLGASNVVTAEHARAMAKLHGLNHAVAKAREMQKKVEHLGGIAPYKTSFPEKEERSPGEEFAAQTQQEYRAFLDEHRKEVHNIEEARELLSGHIQVLAEKYEATPGQVRYVTELYDLALKNVNKGTKDEYAVCSAWAAVAEYVPHIHELIDEFERRIAQIYWPPAIDSAATLEATLMAATYCWSAIAAKNLAEWIVANDGKLIGNLLGVLSRNGHSRIAMFVARIEPIKHIQDFIDFGLSWLNANFSKLEIGHKLAASLCLTEVPDDLDVKAPWPAWSFVIPDGLLAVASRPDGTKETYARVLCTGSEISYLVSSTGRCVGPIDRDQSDAPEDIQILFKLLRSLVKGACLALSDPDQYKKQSLSKNEGSFKKTKRTGGAPELNNARYMLSASVQVDLRDVVHAVQRGEKRKGGKLTVQFLVRGHWKNQACGPKLSLHKRIWIQPFWKGPEETRVLLRDYIVKDREEKDKDGQPDV